MLIARHPLSVLEHFSHSGICQGSYEKS